MRRRELRSAVISLVVVSMVIQTSSAKLDPILQKYDKEWTVILNNYDDSIRALNVEYNKTVDNHLTKYHEKYLEYEAAFLGSINAADDNYNKKVNTTLDLEALEETYKSDCLYASQKFSKELEDLNLTYEMDQRVANVAFEDGIAKLQEKYKIDTEKTLKRVMIAAGKKYDDKGERSSLKIKLPNLFDSMLEKVSKMEGLLEKAKQ